MQIKPSSPLREFVSQVGLRPSLAFALSTLPVARRWSWQALAFRQARTPVRADGKRQGNTPAIERATRYNQSTQVHVEIATKAREHRD
jgi:hypothetical protein